MRALKCSTLVLAIIVLLLGGCGTIVPGSTHSETRSLVADLPAEHYRSIAVFVENFDEIDRLPAEQAIIGSLGSFGVRAVSGPALFEGRHLDDQSKAKLVQKDFDAVLYVSTGGKVASEQKMENLVYNGQDVIYVAGGIPWYPLKTQHYIIKADGSVYKPVIANKLKSDLQDTKTNIQVWSSETIVTGDADQYGNPSGMTGTPVDYSTMLLDAAKQIAIKMREDHVI